MRAALEDYVAQPELARSQVLLERAEYCRSEARSAALSRSQMSASAVDRADEAAIIGSLEELAAVCDTVVQILQVRALCWWRACSMAGADRLLLQQQQDALRHVDRNLADARANVSDGVGELEAVR